MNMKMVFASLGLLYGGLAVGAGLPDTGQDDCAAENEMLRCSVANSGDGATLPRQDGRFGRDAAAFAGRLSKTGGGDAGFDFTRICNNGEAAGTGSCPAVPVLGDATTQWGCTRDNVTGLIWEVKKPFRQHPQDPILLRDTSWTYTWYDATAANPGQPDLGIDQNSDNCADPAHCDTQHFVAAVNAAGLCGASDWRLPSKRELEMLVHIGKSAPTIEATYFPNASAQDYWSGNTAAINASDAWVVGFSIGKTSRIHKQNEAAIRVVRGSQF